MAWQVQTDKPLFPDLLWDQPQTKAGQPRLLIVGGRRQSLAGPLQLYQQLQSRARLTVAVPDVWQKRLPQAPPAVVFCPSNPSGSLASRGLEQLLALAAAADGLIIGPSLGANQETIRLSRQLLEQVDCPAVLTAGLIRQQPAGQLTAGRQIAVPDAVGLGQLLAGSKPAAGDWSRLDQSRIKAILADPGLRPLNLVVGLAGVTWVKVGEDMCYNIGQIRGPAGPSPLILAGWVGLLAASHPGRLFAAATAASYQASRESD